MTDIKNPLIVSGGPEELFWEFHDQYDLRSSKAMLWDWFKATTTGNYSDLTLIERENIATFYERMDDLMEKVFSLKNQMSKTES